MTCIAILGAGSWGTALATILPDSVSVTLWARDGALARQIEADRENRRYLPGIRLAGNVHATADMEMALAESACVVFAVPSAGIREAATLAAPYILPNTHLISASKGLEAATGLRMSEVIRDTLTKDERQTTNASNRRPFHPSPHPSIRLSALSGPNLALEVAQGIPTASVAAAADHQVAEESQRVWMGPTFRVYASADLVGVELAGAMKNVIAIAAGVCEGIRFGDNSRAALMTRGLAEITRLGVVLGAQPATFLGLAGVGDLIATGGSRLSRNYRVGIGLGRGRPLQEILDELGQVAEGVPTTQAICILARRTGVEMPISEALHGILFDAADVRRSITSLMMRPPKSESDF